MHNRGFMLIYLLAALVIPEQGRAASVSTNLAGSLTAGKSANAYGRWPNGPSKSASFFPIGVFNQGPEHIAEFRAIGINTFVVAGGLGPRGLTMFADAGMPVIPMQSSAELASRQGTAIVGWAQQDELDNAQPNPTGGYGPCLTPSQIVTAYDEIRRNDTTRPVYLNFGRGVAVATWRGRGSCIGETASYYPLAVAGGDIISFDVYPVAKYGGDLQLIAKGIDNLKSWIAASGTAKVMWNFVEGAPIGSGVTPSPTQVKAEVWMSLIHGSQGIIYFVHQFGRDGHLVRDDGVFNFPSLIGAVTAINAEVTSLAPVLNSPTIANGVAVSRPGTAPISTMVKKYGGSTYVFAIAMRDSAGAATFTLPNVANGSVQALGEGRRLTVSGGSFRDAFAAYGVHLYRITAK